jgi:O-acetyl-ADP-ribose deacetylase (regulator of RNase III)
VALPAISTGVYRYPLAEAARVAVASVRSALQAQAAIEEARFWLFDRAAYDAFERALARD